MMVQGTLWQASTKSLASTDWHFLATRSMGLTQPSTLETWQSPTNFVLADPEYLSQTNRPSKSSKVSFTKLKSNYVYIYIYVYVYTVYIILIDNRVSKTCWIRGCLTSQGFLLLDRVKTPGVGWVPDLHPPLCDEALEVVYVLSVNWTDFSWPNWPIWFQWQMLADVGHHRILTQVRLTISKGQGSRVPLLRRRPNFSVAPVDSANCCHGTRFEWCSWQDLFYPTTQTPPTRPVHDGEHNLISRPWAATSAASTKIRRSSNINSNSSNKNKKNKNEEKTEKSIEEKEKEWHMEEKHGK